MIIISHQNVVKSARGHNTRVPANLREKVQSDRSVSSAVAMQQLLRAKKKTSSSSENV